MKKNNSRMISLLLTTVLLACGLSAVKEAHAVKANPYEYTPGAQRLFALNNNDITDDKTSAANDSAETTNVANDGKHVNDDETTPAAIDDEAAGSSAPETDIADDDGVPLIPKPQVIEYMNNFQDINEADWFYKDVIYMFTHQLMTGTSADSFSPNEFVTRGMVITVLFRMMGSPAIPGYMHPFIDVDPDKYYSDAVLWASKFNIAEGYDNIHFAPNDYINREQLALFIYRFEVVTKEILPEIMDIELNDMDSVSIYAKKAVNFLVHQGIISGKPGNLFDPGRYATRAEFAAMLSRFSHGMLHD